jgi:flavin reductase (DIM6/NTAB) family NADH-FMN oxidoreductase RutF
MTRAPVRTEPPSDRVGDDLRRFMRTWPTGVTVVTSLDRGTPVGCTVNAMMSVSLSPPLLVVALATASATLDAIRRTSAFGLNVLSAHQERLCRRFACGSQDERFRDLPYRLRYRLPMLRDVVAAAVCTVHEVTSCGDHVLVIGAPVWFASDGRDCSPLVFYQRAYHELTADCGSVVDRASA